MENKLGVTDSESYLDPLLQLTRGEVARHYPYLRYTRLSELFQEEMVRLSMSKQKLLVFGVIVSFAPPKKTSGRASHKFCMSFSMVDRSHPNLTNAVVVNWFTNNPEDMRLAAVAVGDFVQVQGMYVSSYKDSPQLNGSKHNSSFLVLHRKRSYHTGQFIETAGGEDVVSTLAATTNAQAKWDCYPPPEPNSPISEALIRTATKYTVWAETLLANNGLSDNRTNYSTLHGVRQLVSQLRRFAGPDSYNSLQPVGVLNLAEQRGDVCTRISDTADGTIVNTFRCDVVCIIAGMRLFKSSEGGENSISADRPSFGELLVWDGSTNGVLGELSDANSNSSSSEFSEGVDSRLQVARVYLEASRQNTQPLSEPSCSFNIWKALYTAENSMQNTILGSAITIKLVGESILEVASNLQVGMWVRIRGLHIDTPVVSLNSLTATAHADTHICAMYPYYWDVRNIVNAYYLRLYHHFIENVRKRDAVTAVDGNATGSNNTARPTLEARKRRLVSSDNSYPLTSLGHCMALPAPAKFCCVVKLVSWWPETVAEFMRNVDDKQEFLFALRLADDTGVTDVIVHGDDAKKFLFLPKLRNISPTFDGEFQDKVLEQLEAIKKTQILFEVHLRMYSSVERSRGELARRVRSDVKEKNVKRFNLFDTNLWSIYKESSEENTD